MIWPLFVFLFSFGLISSILNSYNSIVSWLPSVDFSWPRWNHSTNDHNSKFPLGNMYIILFVYLVIWNMDSMLVGEYRHLSSDSEEFRRASSHWCLQRDSIGTLMSCEGMIVLEKRIKEVESIRIELEDNSTNLAKRLFDFNSEKEMRDNDMNTMKTSLSHKDDSIKELNNQVITLSNAREKCDKNFIMSLQERVDGSELEKTSLHETITSQRLAILDLESDIRDSQLSAEASINWTKKLEADLNEAFVKLQNFESLNNQFEEQMNKVPSLQARIQSLEQRLAAETSAKVSAAQSLETVQSLHEQALAAERARVHDLEQRLAAETSEKVSAAQSLETVQSSHEQALAAERARVHDLEQRLLAETSEKVSAAQSLETVQSSHEQALAAARARVHDLEQRLAAETSEKVSAAQSLETVQSLHEQALAAERARVHDLEQRLAAETSEKVSAAQSLETVQSLHEQALAAERARVHDLEQRLSAETSEKVSAAQSLETVQSSHEQALAVERAKVHDLEQRLSAETNEKVSAAQSLETVQSLHEQALAAERARFEELSLLCVLRGDDDSNKLALDVEEVVVLF